MSVRVMEQLKLSDFDYDLPESFIAQEPSPVRDRSRLMVMDRRSGTIEHRTFIDIERCLNAGDVLVVNDTRVFPCRLMAKKRGGGKAEIFLIAERGRNNWDALVKGGVAAGKRLDIAPGIEAEMVEEGPGGAWPVRFHGVRGIRAMLSEKQIELVPVPLHVGAGTFQPVRTDIISAHRMMSEHYEISDAAAGRINRAKAEGRRGIAVGATSVRTIESAAAEDGRVSPGKGDTGMFIYPGYTFKVTDGLITNFHLPKSTLLMLVSAFAGREAILSAYRAAVAERYRFYSYGDAMCIL